jgi:allophanate hydrolase subunit 2
VVTLKVLMPGLHTLVVDFGRPRYRSLGVPVGGAADRCSLALGNALVGNPSDAAALEFSLAGPTLQADGELACVVYGAPFALKTDHRTLTVGKTFTLRPGEALHIGSTVKGMRAYLCIRGGMDVPVRLGSRSSFAALSAGAEFYCQSGVTSTRTFLEPSWPCQPGALRVVAGPQADWFRDGVFYRQPFTVTPSSNRMGLRLQGEPLELPRREMVSQPVCPGAVQVTRDGQCIILGIDGQTIGGYPKIAQVVSADLDVLGQLRPGARVVFEPVSLDEAESLYHQKQALLREWVTRLRTAAGGFC